MASKGFLIGAAVRRLRKIAKMSQVELMQKTGLRQTYISRLENSGLNDMKLSTAKKIADAIGITVTELMTVAEEESRIAAARDAKRHKN